MYLRFIELLYLAPIKYPEKSNSRNMTKNLKSSITDSAIQKQW